MADRHANCLNPSICLCAVESNHNEPTLRDGVRENNHFASPKGEPMEYERALRDAETLKNFIEEGLGNNSPNFVLIEMTKLMITSGHMISKFDLVRELTAWCKNFRVDLQLIDESIEMVFADFEMFGYVKKIANCLGRKGIQLLFDRSQVIELSEWIKGNLIIKRIDIDGDLLVYNGRFYERKAEPVIRRLARDIIPKPKTTDITEIVNHIKDTAELISWKDVEHSIHIKCLRNGLFDIKSGVFSTKFNPEYIILNEIPHNYNENSGFGEIDKIVISLIPDKNHRQSFYDFISSCLHPYTGIDYQFGLVGVSGTGKSQLGELVKLTLGKDNCKDNKIHDLAIDQTKQKDAAYSMLNYDDDLNDQSIKQIDVIKKWVTQSSFTIRGIYEQPTTFRPMSRLMFSANDLYEISNPDDAEAIYDRTYLVRVDKKHRHQADEIKNVIPKIATGPQLEGFITYLLKNANWMYNNEKYHHPIGVSQVESIWNTFGNRIKEFKKKMVVHEVSYRLDSNDPYNAWQTYCIRNNYKPKSKREFKEVFDELVGNTPTKTRKKTPDGESVEIYAYTGIRLKSDEEIAQEEQTAFDKDKVPVDNEEALKALVFFMFEKIQKITNNTISAEKIRKKELELVELIDSSEGDTE